MLSREAMMISDGRWELTVGMVSQLGLAAKRRSVGYMNKMRFGVTFFAAILACLWLSATWAVERGKLPMASDLSKQAKLAREKQIPILILFSAPDCDYCHRVREEVLIPTTYNAAYDDKVIMIEVESGNSSRMIDFDGHLISHADFSAKHRVGLSPTVKFFDAKGREVADPIIGLVTVDFFGGSMDKGIDKATAKIRALVN